MAAMRDRRPQEQRRGEIVDAALSIIARRGITALTVASLAKEVGLTGGALYRHFASTDAILEAAVSRMVERLNAAQPDASLEPMLWLERFVEVRSKAAGGIMRFILSEQLALAMPKAARAMLHVAIANTLASVEGVILRGQEQGVIRRDVPAAELVPIVIGSVQMLAHARSGGILRDVIGSDRVWGALRTLLSPRRGEVE